MTDPPSPSKKVLIVNDDINIINEFITLLQDDNHLDIRAFTTNKCVFSSVPNKFIPQYAIIDFSLENELGTKSVKYLYNRSPDTFIIMVSSTFNLVDISAIKKSQPNLYFNISNTDIQSIFPCLKTLMINDKIRDYQE